MLLNLLENAMRHGGARDVDVAVTRDGGDLVLSVSDRGPGLAAEDKAHIFKRFHRGPRRSDGGAGLGLAIVRGFGDDRLPG